MANVTTPVLDSSSLNPALNPFSPLALHPQDNPAVAIVLEPLNFVSWSHSIKRALSVKNKIPLVDGSLIPPSAEDDVAIHRAWVRSNDLVLNWILNSISPDIKRTLEFFTSAREDWDELHARYAKSDGTRVYFLKKSLASISKGSNSLVVYYNHFKSLWDEYVSFRPTLKCTCGANCSCNLPQLVAQTQERDVVMKFMIGLDERSQILLQSPLPFLTKIYSLLLQEESQRTLSQPISVQPESIAMLARQGVKQFKDRKRPLKCSNCDLPGHTVDRCYQIIGFPPGWKSNKAAKHKPDTSAHNFVAECANLDAHPKEEPIATNPLFNQELFEQFLTFSKMQKTTDSHSVAGAFVQPDKVSDKVQKPLEPYIPGVIEPYTAGAFVQQEDSGKQHQNGDWFCCAERWSISDEFWGLC